jgi:hypothetical protein
VISGFDTTATVTTPAPPLPAVLVEHAVAVVNAAEQAAAPTTNCLNRR